jgi:hypothetical protein
VAEQLVAEPFASVEQLRLWSVTTLIKLGLGEGEGLIRWGNNQIAAAAVDKRASLEHRVKEDGRDETVKWLVEHRFRKSEKAKVRGTAVHAIAEKIALGVDPGPIAEELRPYVDQLTRWQEKFRPRYLMAEAPVYNVTRRYAGTLDGIVETQGGRTVVIDYKTTEYGPNDDKSRPPWPEVALQLCAYSRAELVGVLAEQRYASGKRYYLFDPTQHHEPMPAIDGALCVVISPYDCFAVPVRIDDSVWTAWEHVLGCAAWQTTGSRQAFGAVLSAPEEAS